MRLLGLAAFLGLVYWGVSNSGVQAAGSYNAPFVLTSAAAVIGLLIYGLMRDA
jgi:hypothetical protein